jgi:ribosomal protein S18 acetylase RimI-like enzyme
MSDAHPPIEIRPLAPADVPTLLELWRRAGLSHRPAGRDAPEALAAQIAAAGDLFVGAFEGERLVGSALGSVDGRAKGWINRVAVEPERRRRGLARALVEHLEERLREHGSLISAALIETDNAASIALFAQMGFEPFDVVYMRKPNQRGA